jgi:hypothetical protein
MSTCNTIMICHSDADLLRTKYPCSLRNYTKLNTCKSLVTKYNFGGFEIADEEFKHD